MMMRGATIGCGLAILMVATTTAVHAQDEKNPHLGIYEYVSGTSSTGEIARDRMTGTIKVTPEEILLLDEEGQEAFAFSYTVESEEAPYKVSMRIVRSILDDALGATAKGLAKAEGDTVTLIYDFGQSGDYPADFEPKGQQHRFVMKKKADAK